MVLNSPRIADIPRYARLPCATLLKLTYAQWHIRSLLLFFPLSCTHTHTHTNVLLFGPTLKNAWLFSCGSRISCMLTNPMILSLSTQTYIRIWKEIQRRKKPLNTVSNHFVFQINKTWIHSWGRIISSLESTHNKRNFSFGYVQCFEDLSTPSVHPCDILQLW